MQETTASLSDLEHGTVNAEYLGEAGGGDEPGGDNEPIETETFVYDWRCHTQRMEHGQCKRVYKRRQ